MREIIGVLVGGVGAILLSWVVPLLFPDVPRWALIALFVLGVLMLLWSAVQTIRFNRKPAKMIDERDPDGLYQGGVKVASVVGAVERIHQGEIDFQAVRGGGEFNQAQPVEYRNYRLDLGLTSPVMPERFKNAIIGNMTSLIGGVTAKITGHR